MLRVQIHNRQRSKYKSFEDVISINIVCASNQCVVYIDKKKSRNSNEITTLNFHAYRNMELIVTIAPSDEWNPMLNSPNELQQLVDKAKVFTNTHEQRLGDSKAKLEDKTANSISEFIILIEKESYEYALNSNEHLQASVNWDQKNGTSAINIFSLKSYLQPEKLTLFNRIGISNLLKIAF